MIKQTEREHMKEPVHVMKKTHKGEEEVQDEEGEDLSTLANEVKEINKYRDFFMLQLKKGGRI